MYRSVVILTETYKDLAFFFLQTLHRDNCLMTISSTDFASLSLPAHVLANLTRLGYVSMTPIQAAALPLALLGKDLIAQAKTGSGKTAAFGIALLANLNARRFAPHKH